MQTRMLGLLVIVSALPLIAFGAGTDPIKLKSSADFNQQSSAMNPSIPPINATTQNRPNYYSNQNNLNTLPAAPMTTPPAAQAPWHYYGPVPSPPNTPAAAAPNSLPPAPQSNNMATQGNGGILLGANDQKNADRPGAWMP